MRKYATDAGCIICNQRAELDHIKTRGSGGSDDAANLMPLCRHHHTMRHAKGLVWMADRFTVYKQWLSRNAPEALERHLARREGRLPKL